MTRVSATASTPTVAAVLIDPTVVVVDELSSIHWNVTAVCAELVLVESVVMVNLSLFTPNVTSASVPELAVLKAAARSATEKLFEPATPVIAAVVMTAPSTVILNWSPLAAEFSTPEIPDTSVTWLTRSTAATEFVPVTPVFIAASVAPRCVPSRILISVISVPVWLPTASS